MSWKKQLARGLEFSGYARLVACSTRGGVRTARSAPPTT